MSQPGTSIRAIETEYAGYRFRSRLEARWAVFFDALKVEYQYEAEGFDLGGGLWYLPDFWLPELDCWLEIKGQEPTGEEREKCERLAVGSEKPVYVFVGDPWLNIARHCFVRTDTESAVDQSCFEPNMLGSGLWQYDWQGEGGYYQGWSVWGWWQNRAQIICLVEGEDYRASRDPRIMDAYAAARSARFEKNR